MLIRTENSPHCFNNPSGAATNDSLIQSTTVFKLRRWDCTCLLYKEQLPGVFSHKKYTIIIQRPTLWIMTTLTTEGMFKQASCSKPSETQFILSFWMASSQFLWQPRPNLSIIRKVQRLLSATESPFAVKTTSLCFPYPQNTHKFESAQSL